MKPNLRARIRTMLESPDPFMIRFFLILASVAALLFLAAWGGMRAWQESRRVVLTHHARNAVESGQWNEALGFLRAVLESHPDDLAANRLMVAFCRKKSPRSYLEWLTRLQGLEPDNSRTSLELAEAHLRLQHYEAAEVLARKLLEYPSLAPSARNILALTAAMRGARAEALEHFREAHRTKPESLPILVNYAAFLTNTGDPSLDAEWEGLLAEVGKREGGNLAALRLRLARATSKKDAATALALAAEIATHPKHRFQDELQYLSTLWAFRPGDYPAALAGLKERCLKDRPHMNVLLQWLMEGGRWQEALAWIEAFPTELQSSIYFRFIRLQCALKAPLPPDRLIQWLGSESWKGAEPLRLAGLAEAHQRAGRKDAAASRRQAVDLASKEPLAAYELLDLVEGWPGWDAEEEALLTVLSKDKIFQADALQKLFQIRLARKDAAQLLPVAEQLSRINPKSMILEGNYLSLALLNDPQSAKLHRACERFFHNYPHNPHALSLQGYALALQGKTAEGLALMERIPLEIRQRAPINLYYAHTLSQAGRPAEAADVAKTVKRENLLDAELKILSAIQAGAKP